MSKIGLVPEEASDVLHIGVEHVREYARSDPTFPVFAVGSKLIMTEDTLREWANNRARLRVGMKTESSAVMEIIRRNRRQA